ncbi:Nif3-like dinuclear metal center hexameric protein [Pedobacter frigiditerrae]|uniref:GTP cyclohydrolase 1 type 2 homolog n=1 Tax=Pedobacter frigiditerrae TaxID=2530452 RepID=A0A4R0N1T4_9SPHI|nr:Nif3-like dinuclear metal center hexameric protein [Pedobacter frigiditerrae]TCC93751.1 Nif3-like dinuclear metal center hexameric protein [Pedobacter frigiditerrae]
MKLAEITNFLEKIAPLNYQEDYDNAGLIVGNANDEVHAALVALDCTEQIVDEAITKNCNLIITHHPIVFKGLKKFNGKTYVERVVLKAIKNNIALYAIHTNLDHVAHGVSGEICKRLGIQNAKILAPKNNLLKKLVTFCPIAQADGVRNALFVAGAGDIGNYSECSFNTEGTGTFKGGQGANPFVGEVGEQHLEAEIRIETIFKVQDERKVLLALLENHPYEEVAYDIYALTNKLDNVGAGMIGWLPQEMDNVDFLNLVKQNMKVKVIRHTALLPKRVKKVAVCGGSGSFLLKDAIAAGADAFITADFKYHEFFDAEQKLVICDIGHYESEQFTSNLLIDNIQEKFPNFAIRLTEHNTNPINYFI